MVVNLINENLDGDIESIDDAVLEKIQALPSVFEFIVRVKPGGYLSPTRDLINSPMRLFMRGNTTQELDRDYMELQVLKKNLFHIKPRQEQQVTTERRLIPYVATSYYSLFKNTIVDDASVGHSNDDDQKRQDKPFGLANGI